MTDKFVTISQEEMEWIKLYFKPPFKYDNQGICVRDSEGKMVCDIRGWGAIQKLENPEQKQDSIGKFIAELLNKHLMNGEGMEIERRDLDLADIFNTTKTREDLYMGIIVYLISKGFINS